MLHLKRRAKAVLADAIDLVAWRFGYHVTAMATSDLPGIDSFSVSRWPAYLGRPSRPLRLRPRDVTDGLVDGSSVLVAGVDVSDHPIETEVIGWGRNGERWLIDHNVIDGTTSGAVLQHLLEHPLRR